MQKYDKVILSIAGYGLSNRLQLIGAMRAIADVLGVPFAMHWTPAVGCPAFFVDLFQPAFPLINEHDVRNAQQDGTPFVCRRFHHQHWFWRYVRTRVSREVFLQKAIAYMRDLRPLSHIAAKIDAFADRHFEAGPTVGVHVRRTDHADNRRRRRRHRISERPFFRAMEHALANNATTKFMFCTDNARTLEEYRRRYDDHLLFFPKEFHTKSRPDGSPMLYFRQTTMEDAVIDLGLLARSDRIIGTKHSTFSSQASWIGNIPLTRL